jgi:hypothetical protein
MHPADPCSVLQSPDIMAELFVEVLGGLANLYIPEFDFLHLVNKHCLLDFLATYAQPGVVDDDILLEVIMFVGVLCNEGTAPLLVASGLVRCTWPVAAAAAGVAVCIECTPNQVHLSMAAVPVCLSQLSCVPVAHANCIMFIASPAWLSGLTVVGTIV